MAYANLRDFIGKLEKENRLTRVSTPVSTHLEMTEIQTRLLADGGPAVLFENVVNAEGAPQSMPVLTNLFGTVERVAWGMEKTPEQLRELGEQLAFLRQPEPPGGWREAMEMLPLLKTVMTMIVVQSCKSCSHFFEVFFGKCMKISSNMIEFP